MKGWKHLLGRYSWLLEIWSPRTCAVADLDASAPSDVTSPARAASSSGEPVAALGAVHTAAILGQQRRARAALADALGPSLPVQDRTQLLGRDTEIDCLFSAIFDLREHALIYGGRGAGKTSLARGFGDYADERGAIVIYFSCDDSHASFAEIFTPYLAFIPANCFSNMSRGNVGGAIASLGNDFGARGLAAFLANIDEQRVILIIDEFDRVTDGAVRNEIATFAKLLSDFRSSVHLLFVGIARDAHDLIHGHASLRRHLVAVGLRPFDRASANALLDEGERRTGLRYDADARAMLIGLAAGSPYHLRLFAFTAGAAAIAAARDAITPGLLMEALPVALENWAFLNPTAAALFRGKAEEGPAQRRRLEAIATTALVDGTLTVEALGRRLGGGPVAEAEAAAALERLADALVPNDDEQGFRFEDALAPQFLLLSCCFAEQSISVSGRNAA